MTGKNILYTMGLLVIVVITSVFLFGWWNQFRARNPEVVAGISFVFQEEIPFDCRFIWDEEVLKSPMAGTVHFPGGRKPRWVKKGEPLVVVKGNSGRRTLRAPGVGYFVAGLDGLEGTWDYLTLWRGENSLPEPGRLSLIPEGQAVGTGQSVGKFLPQPQELRAVGYLDATETIIDEIHRGTLDVKENSLDLPFTVRVRVARDLGCKRKVYLTFPLFPTKYLLSRGGPFTLCLAKLDGVVLPESALVQDGGDQGVFVVEGRTCRFRGVRGRPVGKERFLVTEGLKAGEIVMAKGQKAKEGKVQLW